MKIIGLGICGGGEADRYMEATMKEFERLCDHTVIVGNHITEKERNLIKKYGFELIEDDREWGKDQPNIKTDALNYLRKYEPDWIVALDMDETFDERVDRAALEKLAQQGIAWQFYVVDLWDDDEHYGYAFWNVRFYKFTPEYGLQFQRRNVHCGLAPPIQYRFANDAPYILWHYGLVKKEDRDKKVERYKKYDPQQKHGMSQYYEVLHADRKPRRFNKEELRNAVADDVNKRVSMKGIPATEAAGDEVYVYMMKDGRQIDVKKKDARRYEKRGWAVIGEVDLSGTQQVYQNVKVEVDSTPECAICGSQFKTKKALTEHKKTH